MKVIFEINLRDLEFTNGAAAHREVLSDREMDKIEKALEEIYEEPLTRQELNDIMWFEADLIANILGYKDFDIDIWNKRV